MNEYNNYAPQMDQIVDNFEIQNSLGSEYMKTDEDAEFKRAILQLIYIDDLTSLMEFL